MVWLFFIVALAVSSLISLGVTGLVVKYGKRLGIIDDPTRHKHAKVVHSRPVPRGGGIPIFIAVATGIFLFIPNTPTMYAIIGGMLLLAVVGFLDDRFEEMVSPYVRLVVNAGAALLVIAAGVGIAYVTNPLGGIIHLDQPQLCFNFLGGHCVWVLSDLFALVWLVWMQNMIGWSSGVDGQLPGFVVIAAIVLGILGIRFGMDASQFPVIMLSALTAGAYIGFLAWNFYPQQIIPGYGGKSLAGFLLGILAILSGAKVGALFLVLSVPFIDAAWVIVKRLREGRSPVWGGREHLHHYLLAMGWSKRAIALFYWSISGIFGLLALSLQAASKYFTIAAILLVLSGVILWLHYFSTYLKQRDPDNG